MRTTITLDNDVSLFLGEFQARSKLSFKEAVNQLLRVGFTAIQKPVSKKKPVTLRTFSIGKVLDLSDCPSNLQDAMDNSSFP